jgi:threonine aldolase
MFCLSKALGAPVGSLIAGTAKDMERARLYRKRLGGGMRQAGVLAAAGLIALEEHPAKLRQDHANARIFADLITGLPGIRFDPASVETNMVVFDVKETRMTPEAILAGLKERGVLFVRMSEWELRAATHYDVGEAECRTAAAALAEVLSAGSAR